MRHDFAAAAAAMTAFVILGSAAIAETYRVGPGEKHATVGEVAGELQAGDMVLVTGDLGESIDVAASGTADSPIAIRGNTRVEGGKIVRPKVTVPENAPFGIMCRGDWIVIEGLDVSGALGTRFETGSAITYTGDNLTVRNCRLHDSRQGIHCPYAGKGTLTVEFSELDHVGGVTDYGANMHGIHILSTDPHAVVTVRFSYFHDGAGPMSTLFKSRCRRNVVAYNWFENPYHECIRVVDANSGTRDLLYPMHSDIVGNVFHQGWAAGSKYSLLYLGGEDSTAAGTEGDFHIAHNLFVTTQGGEEPPAALLVNGNVDRVRLYNNAFVALGTRGQTVYEHDNSWDSERTKAFVARRSTAEAIVEGSNNWISSKALRRPGTLKGTLDGVDAGLADIETFDFRPRKDSPLVGAGMWPLPRGRIIDLAPEYEPRRGIPVDLRPKARRKAAPPAIGPFEAQEK